MSNQPLQVTDEFSERKRKLEELRALGIQPYPERFERSHSVSDVRAQAEKASLRSLEEITASPNATIRICGNSGPKPTARGGASCGNRRCSCL